MRGLSLKTVTFMFIVLSAMSSSSRAQVTTGVPAFSSLGGGTFDRVNNSNLNVLFQIPVVSKAGRGLPFNYALAYNSSIMTPVGASGSQAWTPSSNWGWGAATSAATGYVTLTSYLASCYSNGYQVYFWVYSNWTYVDPSGAGHYFPISVSGYSTAGCTVPENYPPYQATGLAPDGSGYSMTANAGPSATVYNAAGTSITPAISGENIYGPIVDTNGNQISIAVSNGTVTYTDSLGLTALTVTGSGTPPSPVTYTYTGPSGAVNVQATYQNYNIKTNFACSGVSEYSASNVPLVNQINLPDGTHYAFAYEGTHGNTGYTTGRLASVTLPTGGVISYAYGPPGSNGITCADGSADTVTRTTPDGIWTYNHSENGSAWTTTVADPASNQTTYNFQANNNPVGVYETERQVGSLETVVTCYNGNNSNCNTTTITLPISKVTATTTLGSAVSQSTSTFNSYGLPTEMDQSDFGSGVPGGLLRKVISTYGGPYPADITDVKIEDGNSNVKSETGYSYNSAGNLTGQTLYNNGGAILSQSITPNSYGVVTAMTDYDSHATNFTTFACGGGNTAFPTAITVGSLSYGLTWDCNGGVVTTVTDPNRQPTSFHYDEFWRLTETDYPDGGKTTTTYNDTQGEFSVVNSTEVTSTSNHKTTEDLDSLGRVVHLQDNSASTTVDTTYDNLGRVASVSNPYYTTSDPTYGITTYSYDALSRLQGASAITHPDNNTVGINYSSNCATITDEAGKARTSCTDGLGRVNSVTEDPLGLNYTTTYSYDPMNNLTRVSQGSEPRTYVYDWLSRLTSASTPESGATNYIYSTTGSICSGDPSAVCTRTDARGITTTYSYDGLNRLTQKSYSDGTTPTAYFTYDETSWAGLLTLNNTAGRLSHAWTTPQTGTGYINSIYSYDVVGRVSDLWQCTPANCGGSGGAGATPWDVHYNYDLAGDIQNWTLTDYFTITNTISSAQRITAVTSSLSDPTHPPTLAQNITYTPWGALSGLQNGCVGTGCTQTQETYTYNKRLQPTQIQLGTTGSPGANYTLAYNYTWPTGQQMPNGCSLSSQPAGNNGNVMGYTYTDNTNNPFSHSALYAYDGVNRLACAQATGNSSYNLAFSYDPYGNMTCSLNPYTQGYCPQHTFNLNNHIADSGYTYDAAGNLTNDGTNTFTWDAEGRTTNSNTAYDAFGRTVYYQVPWTYMSAVYDPNGDWLGTADPTSLWVDQIRAGERKIAAYSTGNNGTYLQHPNLLGSTTQDTNHLGNWTEDILWYPWGQLWQTAGSPWEYQWATWQAGDGDFKGAWYRTYDDFVGRWLSPDPLAGDITNPQSLNRYAYVLNNPTSNVDPLGLDGCDPEFDTDCDSGDVQCSITDASCDPAACDPDVACGPIPSGGGGGAIPPGVGSGGFPPPGLGGIGIWGGGMGSGPLSGDYGVGLPPLGPGGGPPCDFGTCGSGMPGGNGFGPEAGAGAITLWGVVFSTTGWASALTAGLTGGILVAGAVALPYDVYKGYQLAQAYGYGLPKPAQASRQEKDLINYIARKYCVDRNALGDAIHNAKKGRPGDLTPEEIEEIAKQLPKFPGCTPQL